MKRRSWIGFLRRIARRTPRAPGVRLSDIEQLRLALGRQESRIVKPGHYERLRDAEFRVFSQFGEDGIIQYLISKVPIEHDVFVEFGVEDYSESNTRFLLCNDNWRGLILDGGISHIDFIQSNELTPQEGWVDARFRESRDAGGTLTYLGGRAERIAAIADMPLTDVAAGKLTTVGQCLKATG